MKRVGGGRVAEGGQKEAELEAGRLEERARNGVERRNGVAAAVDKGTGDRRLLYGYLLLSRRHAPRVRRL